MVDTLSRKARSERMARIKSHSTGPEKVVRSFVRDLGVKFRTHDTSLPGSPDLAVQQFKKAIFVHGCFWHRHGSGRCRLARLPKSRHEFWIPKLEQNRKRDLRKQKRLNGLGWSYIVVWECQLIHAERVRARIGKFLATSKKGRK